MANENEKSTESISDVHMSIVAKDFFFDGLVLPVNVYLRIKPGSYLLIGKKGDKSNFTTMHSFNNPNNSVYVKAIDNNILIKFVTDLTSKVVGQKNVPESVKAKFMSGLAHEAIGELEKTGFTSTAQLQKVSQLLVQLTQKTPMFDDMMKIMQGFSDEESKHSMMTCMIALVLCDETDVHLPAAQEKVAMAALLHDVGLKTFPKGTFEKPRHTWSVEDTVAYEQHPVKAAEILRDVRDLHSDVLLMIVEHHENSTGTGFPRKIRDVKISHLGKILGLANCFANLLHSPIPDARKYTPDEAVNYIENILGQPYNKQLFLALKNIINKQHLQSKT